LHPELQKWLIKESLVDLTTSEAIAVNSLESLASNLSKISIGEVALVERLGGIFRVVLLSIKTHLLVETELLQ